MNNGSLGRSRACLPNCTCGRHRAVHRPDCQCVRCGGRKRYPSESTGYRLNAMGRRRKDRCACGHVLARHDAFGCKTCEARGVRLCTEFRLAGSPKQPRDNTFAREVKREGFIAHNAEIATCTTCWQPIKIGWVHSVSCVINARAHAIKCREHAQKLASRRSPNRAERVR